MTTSLVALSTIIYQVMSAILLAASSDEGQFAVSLLPITTVLADCGVSYSGTPCTPALQLICNKQTAERIREIYGQPLLTDALSTSMSNNDVSFPWTPWDWHKTQT